MQEGREEGEGRGMGGWKGLSNPSLTAIADPT